jgi:hypothetical protein
VKLNFRFIFAPNAKPKAMVNTKLNDYTANELWSLYIAANIVGRKDLADKLLSDYHFVSDMDLEKSS